MKRKKRPSIAGWALVAAVMAVTAGYFILINPIPPAVKIYFLKGESLITVDRELPKDTDPLVFAAAQLMKGPSKEEEEAGVFSEIPKGTRIIKIEKKGEAAEATFSDELEEYGGGSAKVQGLVAQIVYTFTGISGIKRVKIKVGKKNITVLGGEGFVIDKALSREEVKL